MIAVRLVFAKGDHQTIPARLECVTEMPAMFTRDPFMRFKIE
jgi:hypothetical protein